MTINIAIENFVKYLDKTIKLATESALDYINELPPSSKKVTYYTHHGIYGDEQWALFDDDGSNFSTAEEMVSEENRTLRVKNILSNFKEQLNVLFDYLKDNDLTDEKKIYLLINLDDYLKKIPTSFHDLMSYKTYTYTISSYYNIGDMDEIAHPIKRYVKCPTGELSIKLELNALKSLALEEICSFNSQQVYQQLPPSCSALTAVEESYRDIVRYREEENVPIAMQETLFDLLTDFMLIDSHEKLKNYKGLSRLKSDLLFLESMNSNINLWLKTIESPEKLQSTIAFIMSATPRSSLGFTFFGCTDTQNKLKKMIDSEIARRKEIPKITPSAPFDTYSNITPTPPGFK